MTVTNEDIARRFHDAVIRKDLDALRNDLYAPDAIIWHNHDSREQTVEENIAALTFATSAFKSFSYTTLRFIDFGDGFVMKFIMDAELHDGEMLQVPVCAIGDVRDGRIVRFEEYYDTADLTPIFTRLMAMPDA